MTIDTIFQRRVPRQRQLN